MCWPDDTRSWQGWACGAMATRRSTKPKIAGSSPVTLVFYFFEHLDTFFVVPIITVPVCIIRIMTGSNNQDEKCV